MTDLALLPAHELALRVRRREVSAVELLDHHLARLERLNPAINAVVVLDTDAAKARAQAADAALARRAYDGEGVLRSAGASHHLGLPSVQNQYRQ